MWEKSAGKFNNFHFDSNRNNLEQKLEIDLRGQLQVTQTTFHKLLVFPVIKIIRVIYEEKLFHTQKKI
jgi:hypothetical protein